MKAKLKLVGVELPRALFKREPYVTAVAIAHGTEAKSATGVLVVAPTDPADLDKPRPELGLPADPDQPASTEVTSEVFRGVDRDHPLHCDVVLFEGEVGEFLVVRGALMESDGGYRRAGERLDTARHALEQTPLTKVLAAAGVAASGAALALADDAGQVIAGLLRANGDDVFAEFAIRINGVEEFRQRQGEILVADSDCVLHFEFSATEIPEPAQPAPMPLANPAPAGPDGTTTAPEITVEQQEAIQKAAEGARATGIAGTTAELPTTATSEGVAAELLQAAQPEQEQPMSPAAQIERQTRRNRREEG